jgi:hypothetical protein
MTEAIHGIFSGCSRGLGHVSQVRGQASADLHHSADVHDASSEVGVEVVIGNGLRKPSHIFLWGEFGALAEILHLLAYAAGQRLFVAATLISAIVEAAVVIFR